MKNWNDEGTVHYDAATNMHYTEKKLSFIYRLQKRELIIRLPQDIRDALKQEDWDQAIIVAQRAIDRCAKELLKVGANDIVRINRAANIMAHKEVCEHLYNAFTIEQARRGNKIWATPEGLQDIGPKPEEDAKYLN